MDGGRLVDTLRRVGRGGKQARAHDQKGDSGIGESLDGDQEGRVGEAFSVGTVLPGVDALLQQTVSHVTGVDAEGANDELPFRANGCSTGCTRWGGLGTE